VNLHEYPDREMMMLRLADRLAGELGDFLRRQEKVSLAVPGGTTPGPVFDVLSGLRLDWDRVAVMPTDERWVATDSPRSNARLIRERLLTGEAAGARFVGLTNDEPTPEAAIPALIEAVRHHLPLTVCLLGMGEDGHIASLFPGADRLAAALSDDAPPVMALHAPGAPEPRVTLTAPVLTGALSVHLLIAGPEKRAALEAAAGRKPDEAPVKLILDQAMIHWAE
jgi:6-phosphogluconolactonase